MRLTLLLALLLSTCVIAGQSAPRDIVTSVFDAMRTADTTTLRRQFHPEANLYNITTRPDGSTLVSSGKVDAWLEAIVNAEVGAWDERTAYVEIRQEGHLATAWAPYVFYYQGGVHHCGTTAFQLVKDSATDRWRILHFTETRRDAPGDCSELAAKPSPEADIRALATRWHRAAATADSTTFFDAIANDGYYLGTDKGEHWSKEEFLGFAAPHFARGKAWAFTAKQRNVFYDPDRQIAWWDEVLDTWMGPARGTAVVERSPDGKFRIKHYTLSMLVPNERVQQVIKAIDGQ